MDSPFLSRSPLFPSEEIEEGHPTQTPNSSPSSNIAIVLFLYLFLAMFVCLLNPEGYPGIKTFPAVNACVFIIIGFGIIHLVLTKKSFMLARARGRPGVRQYFFDFQSGRMSTRLKVIFAVGVVVLCIESGMFALYYLEDLDLIDALYLSVVSVTTVGYGNRAFKTLSGRLFASVWLLVSTVTVASAFLFLVRLMKHQRIAKDLTVEDFTAADVNHNGFSKSEFTIYKLKEMGKISEKSISEIREQFKKLDPNNTGKINCRI